MVDLIKNFSRQKTFLFVFTRMWKIVEGV